MLCSQKTSISVIKCLFMTPGGFTKTPNLSLNQRLLSRAGASLRRERLVSSSGSQSEAQPEADSQFLSF